jgi:hypothetical protein
MRAYCSREVVLLSTQLYRPGEIVPVSGQYGAVDAWYRVVREVTCVRGEPFPPTRVGEIGYVLRDATAHSRY